MRDWWYDFRGALAKWIAPRGWHVRGPNLSEIVTETLRNRSGTLAENITKNSALLSRLKEKAREG